MKKHTPKFEYWEDDHTSLLRKERGDKWADDREFYVRQHVRSDNKWPHEYFLNQRCWKLMREEGPFVEPYRDCEELVDRHYGMSACIFCPGPTMQKFKVPDSGISIAVNSAGFAIDFDYWCMAESGYAKWLLDQRHPIRKPILATARVATVLRHEDRMHRGKDKFDPVYVLRWEEEAIVPYRTPAVSITNALVTAWQMGCSSAFLIGLDLSKSGGAYKRGLPHTEIGARNPFDDQIKALKQFSLPGFHVFNCSPLSKDVLSNFEYVSYEALQNAV
jgi:hypothetical protein